MKNNIKQCHNCGSFFESDHHNQKYCSEECKAIKKSIQKSESYMRMYRNCNIDDYVGDNIFLNESEIKSKPSKEAIKDMTMLLEDFGVKITDIPEFNTYSDMNSWKNEHINKALN